MNLLRYEDHEEDFLEAMATRFCFHGNDRLAFKERLREANSDLQQQQLAEVLERDLRKVSYKKDANPVYIVRDRLLKSIYPKLIEEGCTFTGAKQDWWKQAKRYLREELYPEWVKQRRIIPLTCEQLWQELWRQAKPTNKMQPILLNDKLQPVSLNPKLLSDLEMGEAEIDETAPISIPLNSKIRLDINLEQAGYLLLLEKGTSGKLWCLCPSGFAPEWRHSGGRITLPLASSRHRYFKLTGSTGGEEIVAVITRNLPELDWLPKPGEPLLQLQEGQLTGLLDYLKDYRDSQLWRMAYQVTV